MALNADGTRLFALASQRDWFATAEVIAVDVSSPLDAARWPVQTLLSALEGPLPDLVIDQERARLLVASSSDHALIPIDLASGQVGPRLPLGIEVGEVVVDESGGRLYVSDSAGWVHVLDRRTYAEIDRVYGGRYISLDPIHHRLYAGDARVPTVSVFSTDSLAVQRTIPQPGKPRAHPLADQVVVVNRRFYLFDGASGQARGTWLPDVGQPPAECPGCYYTIAQEIVIDAQRGLTATITYTPWPGKPGPRESIDYDLASGHAYYALTTGGYVYFSSITTYPDLAELDRRGQRVLTLDGLSGYLRLDPLARRLYVARGDTLYVLDSETLNRIGQVHAGGWEPRIAAVDGALGRMYAPHDDKLAVWTRQGAAPPPSPPPQPAVLTNTISAILPSPAFATDQTLLATINGHLCRSTDGGQHWVRLRGGLPEFDPYSLMVNAAFSPDYAHDRAMFAGVYVGDTLGAGVYCSADGGKTWTSCGDGLYDLRVYRVVPSPQFAQDRTLLAYAHTQQGQSVYRSTNGGQGWQLVARQTGYDTPPLPRPEELFPARQVPPQFQCDYQGICQRSDDGGKTWKSLDTRGARLDQLVQYALSPDFARDHTIYFLTQSDLYRYQADTGAWSVCSLPFFHQRDYTNSLSALAVAATGDSAHDLFVGSSVGELRRFAAHDLSWAKVEPSPTRSVLTPTPTPCAQSVDERFAISGETAARLGCPLAPAIETWLAWQSFERGTMLWRQDLRLIYVLQQDMAWSDHQDTWAEGQPDRDPTLVPPAGRHQPVRGFGKVWRDQLGGSKAKIGWATAAERGFTTLIQSFTLGTLLQGEKGMVYAFYTQGTWETITP
jgi:DNA-binding beta-propeller fold protein YncE